MLTFAMFVAGFVALVAGGDLLVRGAVRIALRLGLSPLLIGITLVGFGTSTPELVTSLQAALAGSPGIALGNVVGSNTANILLILGISAAMSPMVVDRRSFLRDGPAVALAALALLGIVLAGGLGRLAGLALLAGLLAYMAIAVWQERGQPRDNDAADAPGSAWISLLLVVAGLALTILGARWLVSAAVTTAASLGVSETVIGLTIVAVGTSLPELVTSVMAALRRQGAIAFGNILGSNIYNVLGILGTVGLVIPIPVPPEIIRLDIWVMLAATAALFMVTRTGWRISRFEGAAMLAAYAGYVGWLVATA